MFKFSPSIPGQIDLGFMQIRFYAICILLGGISSLLFTKHFCKKHGYDPRRIEYIFYPAFLGGILGARLWYVITQWGKEFSFDNFAQVFNFAAGGLAVHGGVVVGIIVGVIAFRKLFPHKSLALLADYAVMSILMAQAIGRLGNFFNHEVYGRCIPRSSINFLPSFILDNIAPPYTCGTGQVAVPLFLIEALANLGMFLFLALVVNRFYRKTRFFRAGDFVAFYFIWYGILRAILENFRDPDFILITAGMHISVVTAIVFIAIGVILFLLLRIRLLPFKKKLIIFDLDGTILDNNDFIIRCYLDLFAKYRPDYVFSPGEEEVFLGPPLKEMLESYFSQDSEQLIKEYREVGIKHKHLIHLFPGVHEGLREILAKDIKIALVTTKVLKPAQNNLKDGDIDLFPVIIAGDHVKEVKPSPEGINKAIRQYNEGISFFDKRRIHRWNVVMIGDSQTDLLAARNAFVTSCGVAWSRKVHTLHEVTPDYIVKDFNEILRRFVR